MSATCMAYKCEMRISENCQRVSYGIPHFLRNNNLHFTCWQFSAFCNPHFTPASNVSPGTKTLYNVHPVSLELVAILLSLTEVTIHCVSKTHQLWNGIGLARNYKDHFYDIWQKYSKDSRTKFACFSFHAGLRFINFSSFKPDTEITRILTLYRPIKQTCWLWPGAICETYT